MIDLDVTVTAFARLASHSRAAGLRGSGPVFA